MFAPECISAVWETGIPIWAPKLWPLKTTFQVFFFQLYFNKNYVEAVINDFTMHLIISKWLRIQKCRQKRKAMRQRSWSRNLKIIHRKVLHNVSLSNLENVLQRNLTRVNARECIFRVSKGTNFENFSTWCQPWWHLHWLDVCTSLPKKTMICHCTWNHHWNTIWIRYLGLINIGYDFVNHFRSYRNIMQLRISSEREST